MLIDGWLSPPSSSRPWHWPWRWCCRDHSGAAAAGTHFLWAWIETDLDLPSRLPRVAAGAGAGAGAEEEAVKVFGSEPSSAAVSLHDVLGPRGQGFRRMGEDSDASEGGAVAASNRRVVVALNPRASGSARLPFLRLTMLGKSNNWKN